MQKVLKQTLLACFAIALLAPLVAAVDEYSDTFAKEFIYMQDGSIKERTLLWDSAAQRYVDANQFRSKPAAAGERTFASAILERAYRWRSNAKKLIFDFTKDSINYRKDFKKIANKYVNRRRGVGSVPKIKPSKKEIEVRDLDEFNNIWEYRMQMQNDDSNTVVMTKDDNFFKNSLGTLNDPEVIGRTWVLIKTTITGSGPNPARYTGTYFIEETDIFLRSDFFEKTTFAQRAVLTGLIRFGLGYKKPIWVWDLNADKKTYTPKMFENYAKSMWKDIANEWDKLYYSDVMNSPEPSGYLGTAKVLPGNGFVFDIAEYKTPDPDPANPDPTNRTDVLFVTNLKAYDGNKTFSATFTALYEDGNAPAKTVKKKLFTITGNAYDYPKSHPQIGNWYPTIWLNTVKLGHENDLKALENAIEDYGTKLKIDSAEFKKALQVQVKMSGYLTENGGKAKKNVKVYFVNSDNE